MQKIQFVKMTVVAGLVLGIGGLILGGCGMGARPEEPKNKVITEGAVTYDVATGYFVSNKFEPEAKASYLVVKDEARFSQIFGVGMVMGDQSHRFSKEVWKNNVVVGVVKRGKALVNYMVAGVTVENGVLKLEYLTRSEESKSASFACPLVVAVPKGNYKEVRFVEDGVEVKVIKY